MARVYVDTSAFYPLLVHAEEDHVRAREVFERLRDEAARLVANSFVVLETVSLLQRRWGIEAVRDWERRMEPLVEIEWVDAETYRRAMVALLASADRHISLTDCSSFETIRQAKIERVFSFDRHFRNRGFELLPGD
ncbi:MAG TPA: PIN domain-containing protein [Gemmatimonadota bacterium]|nr:PIN domain-containing protein [Gemmatimonadota bacterium]